MYFGDCPINLLPASEQKRFFLSDFYDLIPHFDLVAKHSSLSPFQKIQFISERYKTNRWEKDQENLAPLFEHSLKSTPNLFDYKLSYLVFCLGPWHRNIFWEELKKRNQHEQFIKYLFTQSYSVVS